jgi:poly(hydroxyalkanoate) granule-associated protein
MVKKMQKDSADNQASPDLTGAVKDSAQQIWLAGLGAFAKAQQEGGKVFESLVKEGLTIQRKTQSAAEEKVSDATQKMTHLASDIQSKAGYQWDKLENIFEERVAKALNKLGVPSARDMDALMARMDELNKRIDALSPKAPATRKAAARKAAAKTAANTAAPQADSSAAKPPAAKRPAARKPG